MANQGLVLKRCSGCAHFIDLHRVDVIEVGPDHAIRKVERETGECTLLGVLIGTGGLCGKWERRGS